MLNNKTMVPNPHRFGVHTSMVSNYKRKLLEGALDLFDKSHKLRNRLMGFNRTNSYRII
jgi:hypothetical protein